VQGFFLKGQGIFALLPDIVFVHIWGTPKLMSLKDILSQVSATTLLLVFLFFCGTLYIISYWSTFNFDITNYIELFDIPKSFVFPLATGLGVAFLSLLAQAVLNVSADEQLATRTVANVNGRFRKRWRVNSNSLAMVSLVSCMLFYEPYREWIVIVVGFTLIGWGFRKINRNEYVVRLIPYKRARFFFSVLITFIPVYSVCKGKLDGIAVWKNRHYYSVADIVYVDDSSSRQDDILGKKLLGKLGSCIVITDSANANITVLNLDKVQSVKYRLTESTNLFGQ
jgi:hypothetical protein